MDELSAGPSTVVSESGSASGDMGSTLRGSSGCGAATKSSMGTPGRSRLCRRCPRLCGERRDFSADQRMGWSYGGRVEDKVEFLPVWWKSLLLLWDCEQSVDSMFLNFLAGSKMAEIFL